VAAILHAKSWEDYEKLASAYDHFCEVAILNGNGRACEDFNLHPVGAALRHHNIILYFQALSFAGDVSFASPMSRM